MPRATDRLRVRVREHGAWPRVLIIMHARNSKPGHRPTVAIAFYALSIGALASAWVTFASFFLLPPWELLVEPEQVEPEHVAPEHVEAGQATIGAAFVEPALEQRPSEVVPVTPTSGDAVRDANAGARFSEIVSTSGCWFFSGPAPLGRDLRYGDRARSVREGNQIALTLSERTFRGRVDDNGQVRLSRTTHVKDGWITREQLTGSFDDTGALRADYGYQECEIVLGKRTCTPGQGAGNHCAISAKLVVTPDPPAREAPSEIVCGH